MAEETKSLSFVELRFVEAPQHHHHRKGVCKPVSARARAVVHVVAPFFLHIRVRTGLFRLFHCACVAGSPRLRKNVRRFVRMCLVEKMQLMQQ